jgi:hypothetical protein
MQRHSDGKVSVSGSYTASRKGLNHLTCRQQATAITGFSTSVAVFASAVENYLSNCCAAGPGCKPAPPTTLSNGHASGTKHSHCILVSSPCARCPSRPQWAPGPGCQPALPSSHASASPTTAHAWQAGTPSLAQCSMRHTRAAQRAACPVDACTACCTVCMACGSTKLFI